MLDALLNNILALYLDAAPWLLLGLVAAGLIKAWVPETAMTRWLGGSGLWPVSKAALVGAPLPLCSCGVLPAALGLYRAGASRGSTVSFLIATPETGVDSMAISYALMGPFMAVLRPVAAIFSAIFTGLLTGLAPEKAPEPETSAPVCSSGGCCGSSCSASAPSTSAGRKSLQGLRYALTDIVDDIALWLVIGLVLGGALLTFLPTNALAQWGSGPLAMGAMLLVGVPMYICATASTPLAAALLLAGVSPGTVLVFLLAGPATNIATLAMVRRELGTAVTATYLVGIAVASIGFGLATDALVGMLQMDIPAQLAHAGEVIPEGIAWISAALLALAAIRPIRRPLLGA